MTCGSAAKAASCPPGATGETSFVDLHGLAPDDVWLVSSQVVWHFDGATWSTARRTDGYFRRVWEVAPGDVWLTDYGEFRGNTEYQHYDGSTWTETYAPPSPATWMFPRPGHAHASFALDASTRFIVGRQRVGAEDHFPGAVTRRLKWVSTTFTVCLETSSLCGS